MSHAHACFDLAETGLGINSITEYHISYENTPLKPRVVNGFPLLGKCWNQLNVILSKKYPPSFYSQWSWSQGLIQYTAHDDATERLTAWSNQRHSLPYGGSPSPPTSRSCSRTTRNGLIKIQHLPSTQQARKSKTQLGRNAFNKQSCSQMYTLKKPCYCFAKL